MKYEEKIRIVPVWEKAMLTVSHILGSAETSLLNWGKGKAA